MKMKNRNLGIIATVCSMFLMSMSAMASDQARSASGRGPGNGEGGTPVGGGNSCYFAYSIQKIGNTVERVGENSTYYVFVSNVGTCKLRHIDVRDILPEGAEYVGATPTPTVSHQRFLKWEHIDLWPGRIAVFEITAKFRRHDWQAVNTACAFTPWVGTEICDSVTTTVYRDHNAE
jgi:uncharacterized repeat protein (TIGR01451 family)